MKQPTIVFTVDELIASAQVTGLAVMKGFTGVVTTVAAQLGPVTPPYGPGLYTISNWRKGYAPVLYWHFDGSNQPTRAKYTLMHVIKPGKWGALQIADARNPPPWVDQTQSASKHPVIQMFDGHRTLQINAEMSERFDIWNVANYLDSIAIAYTYEANDLLVLDNTRFLHKGTFSDPAVERLLYRATTQLIEDYGVDGCG